MILFYVFIFSIMFMPCNTIILQYEGDSLGEWFITGFMCGSRDTFDSLHIRRYMFKILLI